MKKAYCIYLDENVVARANKKIEDHGGKLSRLLNKLLTDFVKEDGRK